MLEIGFDNSEGNLKIVKKGPGRRLNIKWYRGYVCHNESIYLGNIAGTWGHGIIVMK